MHERPGPPPETQLAWHVALGAAALLLLPAVLAAIAAGEVLRARGLRWTWALLAIPPAVPVALLAITAPRPFPALALLWLAAAPPLTAAYHAHRNRRDRLHGGAAEQRVRTQLGPLDTLRLRRQTATPAPNTILLGHETPPTGQRVARARPLAVAPLAAHATILGGSNTGKTTTAAVLLEGHVALDAGFVILDGKGGLDLPRLAVRLAARHGRRVGLWSVNHYNDADLDRHRRPWNPVGDGSPTVIKDRIIGAEEQTEPYYRAIAARGLLLAAQHAAHTGTPRLDTIAKYLDDPKGLSRRMPDPTDRDWLKSLGEAERSAVRGMATRLRTMVAGDGGQALLPADDELDLHAAIRAGDLVVFTLPEGLYPELIPHVARYVLQALAGICSRIEYSGTPANTLVFVDELSAFDGDQLCSGLERGRSAGVRFIVATQSLSNLATAGGDKLLHAAIDNAELLIIHRQSVPDAAELLASIGGTEEAWEHTHKVTDTFAPLGLDETGERARRLTDRFRAHPNIIKSLGVGEAVVIAQRPAFRVRRLQVLRRRSPVNTSAPQ